MSQSGGPALTGPALTGPALTGPASPGPAPAASPTPAQLAPAWLNNHHQSSSPKALLAGVPLLTEIMRIGIARMLLGARDLAPPSRGGGGSGCWAEPARWRLPAAQAWRAAAGGRPAAVPNVLARVPVSRPPRRRGPATAPKCRSIRPRELRRSGTVPPLLSPQSPPPARPQSALESLGIHGFAFFPSGQPGLEAATAPARVNGAL
jgi:hypothetical protein